MRGSILWNQSKLPEELPGSLNLLVLLLSRLWACSPYPHLTLLYWSPAKPRRGLFLLSFSPCTSTSVRPPPQSCFSGEPFSSSTTRHRAKILGPSLRGCTTKQHSFKEHTGCMSQKKNNKKRFAWQQRKKLGHASQQSHMYSPFPEA